MWEERERAARVPDPAFRSHRHRSAAAYSPALPQYLSLREVLTQLLESAPNHLARVVHLAVAARLEEQPELEAQVLHQRRAEVQEALQALLPPRRRIAEVALRHKRLLHFRLVGRGGQDDGTRIRAERASGEGGRQERPTGRRGFPFLHRDVCRGLQ